MLVVVDKNKVIDAYCKVQDALVRETMAKLELDRLHQETESERQVFLELIDGKNFDDLVEEEIKRRGVDIDNSSFDNDVEDVYKYMSYCLGNRKVINEGYPTITVSVSQKYSDKVLNAVKSKLESDSWTYVEWERPVDKMNPVEFTVG